MSPGRNDAADLAELARVEEELRTLHQHYAHLARLAEREGNLGESHSIEEADARHREKFEPAEETPGPKRRGRASPQ